jgi:heme/copper-type cytochrome/quinol oxidase subunit 2
VSARQRLTFALIAVAIAVVAVIVIASSGGSDTAADVDQKATPGPSATQQAQATAKATPDVPTVVVKGGQPVGGVKEIEVKEGDQVRFRVVSDVADEIHVHGYDLMKDVSAGGQVSFAFKASITGIFEAELENRGEQIVSLRVDPK